MKRVVTLAAVIAVCTIAFTGAAHASLAVNGVGGHLSIVSPDNVDGTLGLGFLLDMGFVGTQWGLEPYAAYWSNTESAFGLEASISDLIFGARGTYDFLVSSPSIHPYVGAGLGLHFVSYGVDVALYDFGGNIISTTSLEDNATKLALDLGGGLTWDVGTRVSLLTDAWVTVGGDVDQFALRLGMLYRMR